MRAFSNIAITILFALVLVGPGVVAACEGLHIELPSWASAEDAKWLEGGSTDSNIKANLSIEGFASKKLQDAITNDVNGRIPFKAATMLGNAAIQRMIISFANAPKSYPTYPTFFGSERLYIPAIDAVTYMPYKRSDKMIDSIRQFGSRVASFAARHPDKRFVICLVQGYQEPAVNPAYDLMKDPVVPSEYANQLQQAVDNTPNVFFVSSDYSSLDAYYEEFFHTDHHWNHRGIEHAYNDIAEKLGLPLFDSPGEIDFGDYRFSGATARWGLESTDEAVFDTSYDFSNLVIDMPDRTQSSYTHKLFFERSDYGKRHSFYDDYYGFIHDDSILYGNGKDSALVIANSYGAGLLPYIAESHATTTSREDIHPSARNLDARLTSLIEKNECDTVIFIANPTDIAKFVDRCPDYFN